MIRAAGIVIALALTFGAAAWHSADAQSGKYLERPTAKTERTVKRKRYVKRTKYSKRYRAAKRKRAVRRHGGKVSRPAVSSPIEPVVVPTTAIPAPLIGGLPPDFAEMPTEIIVTVASRFDHAFGALTPAPPPMPAPVRTHPRKWPSLSNHGIFGEVVIAFALAGLAIAAIALLMASIREDRTATEERS